MTHLVDEFILSTLLVLICVFSKSNGIMFTLNEWTLINNQCH